jgi:hypothetical protein
MPQEDVGCLLGSSNTHSLLLAELPVFTNGCFVEAKYENVVAERRTASEKLD